jgi:uncharacterized membrane protein
MMTELLVLRLVHILGGIFWVGNTLFYTFFLLPALATAGPAGGQIFGALQQRRLPTYMFVAALLTIFSGLRLMSLTSGNFSAAYFDTASGRGYTVSAVAAVLALLLGVFVGRPTGQRAGQLGARMANAPAEERAQLAAELAALRRRGSISGGVTTALLLIAAGGMAVARYL